MTTTIANSPITDESLHALFNAQMLHYPEAGKTSARERIALLNQLEMALFTWRPRIHQALYKDFGKPPPEVDLVDIYYVLREIRYARQHLRRWMKPQHVSTPLAFFGSRAYVLHEAKGVCLLISPWNYPFNLTLGPLVSALAAGCTAIVKPSEYTPHASALMKEMLESMYPKDIVAIVEGDAHVSQQLLAMPFHHIFFTGSSHTGKIVMAAAAKTLASVTLELGGKCPVVIDATANIERAAKRIVHTKFVNAGQTCIAPDYVLVHQSQHDALIEAMRQTVEAFYPTSAHIESDYCGIIHQHHLSRMQAFLEDAIERGARIVTGGEIVPGTCKLLPTILSHVPRSTRIMKEEIFGPILPVIPYLKTEQAIALIQSIERPLGLYVFGHGKAIKELMEGTRAGGSCINHCALNYYNPNLPFGGVNHSGIGKSHGYAGFLAFSNARGIYKQTWPFTPLDWLHPPYTKAKQRLIDFTLKWL